MPVKVCYSHTPIMEDKFLNLSIMMIMGIDVGMSRYSVNKMIVVIINIENHKQ